MGELGHKFWPVGTSRRLWLELDAETKGRILETIMALRHKLTERTLRNYMEGLTRLAVLSGDLDNVAVCEKVIGGLKPYWRDAAAAAYRHYCKRHRLREPIYLFKRDHRRKVPRIPPLETLKASIAVPRRAYWRAYFRLLYETGARPSEALELQVRDLDLEGCMVWLGSKKGSGYTDRRQLPISELLAGMLRELVKGRPPEAWVFPMKTDPSRHYAYRDAERMMRAIRNRLRAAGYDVQGLRLHIYRHAFGSRLYAETRDLMLVAKALGHRDLRSTMIYIHLQPETPRRYDVVSLLLSEVEAISRYLSEGWEVALQTEERVWLRRPKWAP